MAPVRAMMTALRAAAVSAVTSAGAGPSISTREPPWSSTRRLASSGTPATYLRPSSRSDCSPEVWPAPPLPPRVWPASFFWFSAISSSLAHQDSVKGTAGRARRGAPAGTTPRAPQAVRERPVGEQVGDRAALLLRTHQAVQARLAEDGEDERGRRATHLLGPFPPLAEVGREPGGPPLARPQSLAERRAAQQPRAVVHEQRDVGRDALDQSAEQLRHLGPQVLRRVERVPHPLDQ